MCGKRIRQCCLKINRFVERCTNFLFEFAILIFSFINVVFLLLGLGVVIGATVMLVNFADWLELARQQQNTVVILLMGIFTQIAQILMTRGIQSGVANKMISLKYLGTIYALAIGYLIFGESYGIMSLIGITMVIAGVVLNLWKKKGKV